MTSELEKWSELSDFIKQKLEVLTSLDEDIDKIIALLRQEKNVEIENPMSEEEKIRSIFNKNVRGRQPNLTQYNKKHNGSEGHWLEKQMGIKHNSSNSPDIYNYEMKKVTRGRTTFGDWIPDKIEIKFWSKPESAIKFMKTYGKYNKKKKRWAWANPVLIEKYNQYGQRLEMDDKNNKVVVRYNKNKDKLYNSRENKCNEERKILFGWTYEKLKQRVENKFGKKGYFICNKNKKNEYSDISFFKPIYFEEWKNALMNKHIFLDAGTICGNPRAYMSWRTNNKWLYSRPKKEI